MPESTAGYLRSGFQQRGPGRGWIFASDQLTEMAFKATGKDKVTEEGSREGSVRWLPSYLGWRVIGAQIYLSGRQRQPLSSLLSSSSPGEIEAGGKH